MSERELIASSPKQVYFILLFIIYLFQQGVFLNQLYMQEILIHVFHSLEMKKQFKSASICRICTISTSMKTQCNMALEYIRNLGICTSPRWSVKLGANCARQIIGPESRPSYRFKNLKYALLERVNGLHKIIY